MRKWVILGAAGLAGLALCLLPLVRVEELNYPTYSVIVGESTVTVSLIGKYTASKGKEIKGPPYRLSIIATGKQRDAVESIEVNNVVIATGPAPEGLIALPDARTVAGDLNSDKLYYWIIAYDRLALPEAPSRLHGEIQLKKKGGSIERAMIDLELAPVRTAHYENAVLEALKGI